MTDNELGILLRDQVLAGLARQGTSLPVVMAYQSQTEGRVNGAAAYYFPLADKRYGWQGRTRRFDISTQELLTTERQQMESTFQFYALAPQDPSNLALPTPKDLVNLLAMICNSQLFVQGMRLGGAGVQRITPVRAPFFVNDRSQFEASPSFDITISHLRQITDVTPVTVEVTRSIHSI